MIVENEKHVLGAAMKDFCYRSKMNEETSGNSSFSVTYML